ncbi:MAG TPA: hypothetical protein VFB62_10925, partial [Polyangiaceae bacterium]|nr:hypothetical protein [Polyangiaceae bacterium]
MDAFYRRAPPRSYQLLLAPHDKDAVLRSFAMLDRLAIYGVPALAGLVTAAVLIGPGREQQVVGARVWGFVSQGAQSSALRVHTVLHYGGAYLSSAQDEIELTVEHEGRVLGSWRGATAESGLAEVVV